MTKTLGEIISKKRKLMGLTQTDLANKLGVTEQAVSKWECNQSCPDIKTFAKLAESLGMSSDKLLSIKENKKIKNTNHINDILNIILKVTLIITALSIIVLLIINYRY